MKARAIFLLLVILASGACLSCHKGEMRSWQARVLELYLRAKSLGSPKSGELDVARERASVESMAGMFKPFGEIRCEPVTIAGIPAEWITPQAVQPGRAILYLHGGSFNSGSIATHRTLAGNIAIASKAPALLLGYRLAPEHPFPAAVEDSLTAFDWLIGQGFAPNQVVVAGDSAGGTLALSLLIQRRDRRQPLPAAAVCLSPAPDLSFSGESWKFNSKKDLMIDERKERKAVELYLRDMDPRSPAASPSFADLRGLPPIFIQVGSYEVLLSDSQEFAGKAQAAGVEVTLEVWPGMQHEWQFAAKFLPEGRRAIARIGAFLETIFTR